MAKSIFPSVTVSQIRPLQATNKPLPAMAVGLIGPSFKRIIEDKKNAYYINPEDLPYVKVHLTNFSDGDYIDYDSVKVSLRLASTSEVVNLKGEDEVIIPDKTLLQENLYIGNIGFFERIVTGDETSDMVFMTDKLEEQNFGSVADNFLIGPDNLIVKIKQAYPVKKSQPDFIITSGVFDEDKWTFSGTGCPNSGTDVYKNYWLVAVDKVNSDSIFQFKISSSTFNNNNVTIVVEEENFKPNNPDSMSKDENGDINCSFYNWYVFDIPFGSLRTYPIGSETGPQGNYSIYAYYLRISGEDQGIIGMMKKEGNTSKCFFVPDTKALTSYYNVFSGYVLRAVKNTNPNLIYDFRIKKVGAINKYTILSVPSNYNNLVYTFDPSEDIYSKWKAGYFLVAVKKSNPKISYSWYITSVGQNENKHKVTIDLTGAWDDTPVSTNFSDYNWFLYDAPIGSLELEEAEGFDIVSLIPETYTFSIINSADFYISGKNEITILNYLTDNDGERIGLADVIVDYRVLVTENAGVMYDITSSEMRDSICGVTYVDSINPLGLAALLVELNTIYAYKVIPLNIAYSERDPSAPKSYSGRYSKTNTTYHNVNKLDWLGAKEVLESVKDTQIPYYLVPLSSDQSVIDLFANIVNSLSEPNKMKEMVTFLTMSMVSRENILTNINPSQLDFTVVNGRLRYTPRTRYVSSEKPYEEIDFLSIGAKKGDYIVYKDNDGYEHIVKIQNIYPTFFDLGETPNFYTNIGANTKIDIVKIYRNKDEIAEALSKKGELYNSYRVKLLWGDYVDVVLTGGDVYKSLPMYYGAAAYAAMANNLGTVLPKTNRIITGLANVQHVDPYFSLEQLEIIASGNIDILTQDYANGPVYSKRQLMTDGSELSGVEPVDKLAKYIRTMFRPYLGKHNITNALFDVLNLVLAGIIDTFSPSELEKIIIVEPLRIAGPKKDRLTLKIRPVTYKPFNGLDVSIEVE